MPSSSTLLTLAAAAASASAQYQGFNYGAHFSDGSLKVQSDYEAEFRAAARLEGTNGGFTSARLFTTVQEGSDNPNEAIAAAIGTDTSLLLGLWASAGGEAFNTEITALQKVIDEYCDQLGGNKVAGISVGSEDLYRISPIGIEAGENPGANPDTLVNYIRRVRETVRGSCFSDTPIGHVDTWTAWVNGSNNAVIDAVDFIGFDAYPYFESTRENPIQNGKQLFESALSQTREVSGGKPIWVTETGWPVSGKTSGQAVANTENAEDYWKEVGCSLFGSTNTWWFTFQDSAPTTPNPSFGVIGAELTSKPLYDLKCDGSSDPDPTSSDPPPPPPETSEEPTSTVVEEPEPTVEPEPTDEPEPEPTSVEEEEPEPTPEEPPQEPPQEPEPTPEEPAPEEPSQPPPPEEPEQPTESEQPPPPPQETPEAPAPTEGGDTEEPTDVPQALGTQLNSFGAAVVAVVLAFFML